MKKKNIKTYVFRIIIFIVLSLVIGVTVYTINLQKVTGKKLIMPFDKTIAVVLTGSMEPTIKTTDLIVVEKTDDYQLHDIVVYQDKNTLVVHRIVKIEGNTITTAGDANDGSTDAPIDVSAIQGEVVDIIPFLGLLLKIIKSPIGILLIIALAIMLLVLSYKKEDKEENKEIDKLKEEIEQLKKEINN